jgi:ADP-ribosylglycohydrolase
MIGTIIGDIVGSPYEFDQNNIKTTNFPLFTSKYSYFTDDTVMTLAVAEALMNGYNDPEKTKEELVTQMQKYGHLYPDAGYGGAFSHWLRMKDPQPYNSFGNGAAMRVSPVAWIYDNLKDVVEYAALTASVTHDHPEGIKGAVAVASAIFLARTGFSKKFIRSYISNAYGYDFSRTCDEIRPTYHHVESCQETVPEALTAFFEGDSFEEVLRLAVSLGGDSDTLTAIAASVAEAYYGIPGHIWIDGLCYLTDDLLDVVSRFNHFVMNKQLY